MPFHHHDPKTQDAIKKQVKRLDRAMHEMGMASMDPAEMRHAADRIAQGVEAVKQRPPVRPAPSPQPRIPAAPLPSVVPPGTPEFAVEGGLLNPRSNPALREALRKRGF